ncbi:MAG: alpha/beta hydrolase fold domain-containing protein, partial [Verrucomicrobiota bacterium]
AHYMPWYGSKTERGKCGYHWTMGPFDPDTSRWDGRGEVASQDYPLIGLYDSGDDDALEYHSLLLKIAGIEGVIIDWYGIRDHYDYLALHNNTLQLIPHLEKAGLKFAICYEDQSIEHMVNSGNLEKEQALSHGKEVMAWMEQEWFSRDSYLKQNGQPVLLVFGPQYFEPEQWKELRETFTTPTQFFTLPHLAEKFDASGPFGWPPVSEGKRPTVEQWTDSLAKLHKTEGGKISVAFPGFHDIYRQAGLHDSYGFIDDRNGATFLESLDLALSSDAEIVQLATWNDFGEGTVIEPTWKFGYRFLDAVQARSGSIYTSGDLRLPIRFYRLRKEFAGDARIQETLDHLVDLVFKNEPEEAQIKISELEARAQKRPARFDDETPISNSKYRIVRDIPYQANHSDDSYLGNRCRLDLYFPESGSAFSTVVWFHGGGITKGNKSIPVPLREKGVAVVTANYRLNPSVAAPTYLEDAAAAVAWTLDHISDFGGDPKSVFVSGHSAGGYLASMIGLDLQYLEPFEKKPSDLAGLIPFSGHTITHFTVRKEMGIDGNRPLIDELAPLYHVQKETPPMLLITGGRELELMGRYEENAYFWRMMKHVGNEEVFLRELDGFDHGQMPEPAFPLLLDFMEEYSNE